MGRPPTRIKKLRDGFYIEIRTKGSTSGIKIIRKSEEKCIKAIKEYEKNKEVIILVSQKNGKWVNPRPTNNKA